MAGEAGDATLRRVLLISAETEPSGVADALESAGFAVVASPLAAGVGEAARGSSPDVVVLAYTAEQRHRAWNVLTVLRGARSLRGLPVVVATDDADQASAFTGAFARLGITVLIDPDDDVLVSCVSATLAT